MHTNRTLILLTCLLAPWAIQAAPISILISSADTIIVGTEYQPVQAGQIVKFYLNVEKVFTGSVQPGSTLSVVWNVPGGLGIPDSSSSYRGIWFLKSQAGGNWECIPAGVSGNAQFFPDLSLPVSADALPSQLAYDPDTTPLSDQLILEMAGGTPRANSLMILDVAGGSNSAGALKAFRYLAGSLTLNQIVVGLTGLIQAGDTSGVVEAETLSGSLTPTVPGTDLVASAIRFGFRSTDPIAAASLGRLATTSEGSQIMQTAAAQALASIHTPATLSYLGKLLNNASAQMQIYGAQGLSFFANGVGIPTVQNAPSMSYLNQRQPSVYRTAETDQNIGYKNGQPEPFIQFWKNWWNQHPELALAGTN